MTITDPEKWTARARLELAGRGVGKDLADTVLAEVAQHCADSGENPTTAFGDPDVFADTVYRERVPTPVRADRDRHGLTGPQRRSEVYAQFGVLVIVFSVVAWVSAGWLLPLTTAGLTGTVLTAAAALIAGYAVHDLRASARPRSTTTAWCVVAALVVLAALAFTQLPKTALGHFPTPIITIAGIALLAWALTRRTTTTTPLAAPADNDEWLTQLRTLLIGRHHLSHPRATELATEAAAHLAETGTSPLAEFGPADEYAVTLAEGEPRR